MEHLSDLRNFRMPAEWEKQKAIWFQWPHEDFNPGYQRKLEPIWLEQTRILKENVLVCICVQDEKRKKHLEHQFNFYGITLRNVEFHIIPTNDIWIRDNGPTFVVGPSGESAAVGWKFNGWGGRYPYELDAEVSGQIAQILGIPIFYPGIFQEGGNLDGNGIGDLICTRSATLNENRNPEKSQEEIEEIYKTYLGVKNVIWLPGMRTENIEEAGWSDDTDTHIDTIARFVNPTTIVYSWSNEYDRAYPMLKKNYEALKEAVLLSGRHPDLVKLPIPEHGYYSTSKIGAGGFIGDFESAVRTDASYTNFLISNGVVIVPTYGNVNDEKALAILREVFLDKQVMGLNYGACAENGGEIHCVSQPQF